jgi:hypothetical protein
MVEFELKFTSGDGGGRSAGLTVECGDWAGSESPRPDSMDGPLGHRMAAAGVAERSALFTERDFITGQDVPSGRRFFPVSYSCDELVEEAEALVDTSLASWLAEQPEAVFEEIMEGVGWRIWGGAGYLAALTEALKEAHEWSGRQGGV